MTSKLDYIIKLKYDKEYKGYVADVLNLFGCMSQGKTKEEALKNANKAIKIFGSKLKLNLAIKDFEKGLNALELNKGNIESYLPKVYTTQELEKLLK